MIVVVRTRPGGGARRVELLGELGDWRTPIALAPEPDGAFAASLDLPCGVYEYKLLVDGATFRLDPAEPRTRSAAGRRNNLLVVGGAPEPWLFAPAPPWVEALDRGGVRVLAGLRGKGASRIAFSEDGGASWSHAALERAFDEDEHTLATAVLPTSAARLLLALEADGAPRFEAAWSRPPVSTLAPAWWRDAVVYTVFVDRFRPAEDRAGWERDPGPGRFAGGHLEGVRRSLGELAELGVDTLYLTPVHVGASAHRYDVVDPAAVDPALGGEAAYDALVKDAAARGMRIIQDLSFSHAGRGFPPYEDVLRNGRRSRFASWFVWKDHALVHYGERTDAPLFDLDCAEVRQLVLDAVRTWAERGAKGLRLDMAAEVPFDLGRLVRKRFRELVPDGVVLGEVVPQHAWRWRRAGVVDAATDFSFHAIVTDLVTRSGARLDRAWAELARTALLRGGDASSTVRFVSTHDHPRLATLAVAMGGLDRLPIAYALLATLPGIPMLLYGEERGMRSDAHDRDLEDVWPDRAPMPWNAPPDAAIRALLSARRASPALRRGDLRLLHADASVAVFRREADGDVVDVALSIAREPVAIELEDDELPRLETLVAIGGAEANGQRVSFRAPGAIVARRDRPLGRAVSPARARANLALRDRDLASGAAIASSRPTRFFFSVTERCNLRCAHCITHAPERTRSGTARTMTPAVLDALRDDLGLASYFAFVHGGESLTAPIFYDVLSAIRDARGGEPYVAHLLTNGVMLSASTAERLTRAGVSSISVSLDGATRETNDAIREGGRFDDVCEAIARVVAWRRDAGVDLRIGLSLVVLSQNLSELDRFVDLGARLGVDWIKLEEGVGATAFAKRSLVSCTTSEARAAIVRAMERGRDAGLVMVDHTVERVLFRCRLDEEARVFLAADEHANRADIHPCRAPWDTVCIEPNGDAKALDFFGPVLGNLTRTPLAELWNGPEARRARDRSRAARICGAGPVVCVE